MSSIVTEILLLILKAAPQSEKIDTNSQAPSSNASMITPKSSNKSSVTSKSSKTSLKSILVAQESVKDEASPEVSMNLTV